jgi:hypothetical protein
MTKNKLSFSAILMSMAVIFFITSCSSKKDYVTTPPPPPGGNECATVNAKFTADVYPLMQSKCAISGCHNSTSMAGGFAWTSYAAISAQAAAINSAVQSGIMPKTGSLSAAEKLIIKCWVGSGAPNN